MPRRRRFHHDERAYRGCFRLFREKRRDSNSLKLHRFKILAGVIAYILVDGKIKGPIIGNKKDRPNRLRENERRSLL